MLFRILIGPPIESKTTFTTSVCPIETAHGRFKVSENYARALLGQTAIRAAAARLRLGKQKCVYTLAILTLTKK